MRAAIVAILGLGATLLGATSAHAYEDKVTAGVEAGYAVVVIPETDLPQHGALLGISGSYGLNDIWSLRGHIAYAFHPSSADPLHVAVFGAELLYLIDVLEWVPYFGLGVDGLGTMLAGQAGLELGAHVTLGLEHLLSRDALIGLDIRPHFLPLTVVEAGNVEPVYITVSLRYSLVFEL